MFAHLGPAIPSGSTVIASPVCSAPAGRAWSTWGPRENGRDVAIKLLHSHLSHDDDVAKGFMREVEAARRVAAFCTAAVLDVGMLGDRPYIVSEYVAGETLQVLVRTSGPRTAAGWTGSRSPP